MVAWIAWHIDFRWYEKDVAKDYFLQNSECAADQAIVWEKRSKKTKRPDQFAKKNIGTTWRPSPVERLLEDNFHCCSLPRPSSIVHQIESFQFVFLRGWILNLWNLRGKSKTDSVDSVCQVIAGVGKPLKKPSRLRKLHSDNSNRATSTWWESHQLHRMSDGCPKSIGLTIDIIKPCYARHDAEINKSLTPSPRKPLLPLSLHSISCSHWFYESHQSWFHSLSVKGEILKTGTEFGLTFVIIRNSIIRYSRMMGYFPSRFRIDVLEDM